MLVSDLREKENVFVITPEGEVTADDFAEFSAKVNDYIHTNDVVPNIVIHTSSLPHWKNFAALAAHFRFVREHQRIVQKVAIVTNSRFFSMMRPLVDQFVGAKLCTGSCSTSQR